jgi:hypothetical protein
MKLSSQMLLVLSLVGATDVVGQEIVTALDRTLLTTHMRMDTASVTISDTLVLAFAPTTIQCGKQSCTVRVEVSSQFFNVTSGNAVRLHVKSDTTKFPVTGFEIDGGINRPVAHLTTVSSLKSHLTPGPHTISVAFDMRSPGGKAEASVRTLTIQVFTP